MEILPRTVCDRVLTPALILNKGAIRRNIQRMIKMCEHDPSRWRPHIKTIKCLEVIKLLQEAGVQSFKCATAREAAVLGEAGALDVLVAMSHSGPNLERVKVVADAYQKTRFSVLVEDESLAKAATGLGFDIFIDINPEMNRSGTTIDEAVRMYESLKKKPRGFHLYEGHASKMPASDRGDILFNLYDKTLKKLPLAMDYELTTSGTPAFSVALAHPGLKSLGDRHTVTPGTIVLGDMTSRKQLLENGIDLLEPGGLVVSRVISIPKKNMFTLDAGHKAISADAGVPTCEILGYENMYTAQTPSEEHLPVLLRHQTQVLPKRGDLFYLFPRHICPTVNLYDRALIFDDNDPERLVSTTRINAQGHDLWLDDPLLL